MMQISLSNPDITEREIELVNAVLRTPRLSMGPMLERFEQAMASYVGAEHAVGVSSGTAGLHLAAMAAGIREGDLVITTPFSFVASANCILYQRAIPIFVDIDPQTLNIDPALVTQAVEDLSRHGPSAFPWLPPALRHQPSAIGHWLSAILPVHIFGQPCQMDRLMVIAREHGLVVIEDACEAIGAEFDGQKVGSFGECAVFAFYPNKQMTTSEGGMIVTHDEEWATLFRSLRNQGRGDASTLRQPFDPSTALRRGSGQRGAQDRAQDSARLSTGSNTWLHHVRLGYNYRLDELSAALGVAQLERIEELLAKRERVAQMYNERLGEAEGVKIPYISPRTTRMSWFVYVVRLSPEQDRDKIMAELQAKGIPSRPYFTPIHLQPFYREMFGYKEGDFPITEGIAKSTLALPFYSTLEEEKVDYVCRTLREVIAL